MTASKGPLTLDPGLPHGPVMTITDAMAALTVQQNASLVGLPLIASEMSVSALARLPFLTDAAHRYFFPADGPAAAWPFGAGSSASRVETELTEPVLRNLLDAPHVNVRPLSGLHAMQLVLAALDRGSGSAVLCLHPDLGGHYATADLIRRFGHRPIHLRDLDPAAVTRLTGQHRPALAYLDQCHILFPLDLAALTTAIRQAAPGCLIHADTSHLNGLIMGGVLPHPLAAGADSFGGSTHKTFPGPQKGVLATRDPAIAARWEAVQPTLVSNHHLAGVCSLGLAAAEFAPHAVRYAHQVVDAARCLGHELTVRGLPVKAAARGFTGCHQLWVQPADASIDASGAHRRLHAAGIYVNLLADLPSMAGRPALRLGVAETVWHGLGPADMPRIAALACDAVFGRRRPEQVAADVADLRAARTSPYTLPAESTAALAATLLHPILPPTISPTAPPAVAVPVNRFSSPPATWQETTRQETRP